LEELVRLSLISAAPNADSLFCRKASHCTGGPFLALFQGLFWASWLAFSSVAACLLNDLADFGGS